MQIKPLTFNPAASGKPVSPAVPSPVMSAWRNMERVWRALASGARRGPSLLRVRETRALGDRRFVAVVEFERQRFLIGSSPSSITLLARLADAAPVASADATQDGMEETR